MLDAFRKWRFQRWFRKTYPALAEFKADERLDQLIREFRIHGYTGTAISLERGGFAPEQIEEWHSASRAFIQEHGAELLEYLKPYDGVDETRFGGFHFDRWFVRAILIQSIEYYKKAETK